MQVHISTEFPHEKFAIFLTEKRTDYILLFPLAQDNNQIQIFLISLESS